MILVTGATGTVGRELVGILASMEEEVRAMAHHTEKRSVISGYASQIIYGDYSDPDVLDDAMDSVDSVFVLSPSFTSEQVVWERNITDAAVRAGVGRIVKHSVIGASPMSQVGFVWQHWESEKYIENCGVPYVFVRPTSYMQNVLMQADSIAKDGKVYGSSGDGKVSWVDVRDIASVEAIMLTEEGHDWRTYEITGSESLSFPEVAAKISAVIGRRVEYVDLSPEDFEKAMRDRGLPEQRAHDYSIYQQYYREGRGAIMTPWVYRITGGKPMTFDQFVRDHAEIFATGDQKAA